MHRREVVTRALSLCDEGLTARDVARELGIPERTVAHWRRGDRRCRTRSGPTTAACSLCTPSKLARAAYAYLLGQYLGDGHITTGSRTACLWIYCADDWPGVRAEVEHATAAVLPTSAVSVAGRTGCSAVKSFSLHWLCLFPQHGAGPKHLRSIVLDPWQQDVVDEHTGLFLRGLFHSDGCRITNWTRRMVAGKMKRYEYPRYMFSNESADIMALCRHALDLLDIAHRMPRPNLLSVARRRAVVELDRHVGPKY